MEARDDVNSSTCDAQMEGDNANQMGEKDIENCYNESTKPKWPSIHLLSSELALFISFTVLFPMHTRHLFFHFFSFIYFLSG